MNKIIISILVLLSITTFAFAGGKGGGTHVSGYTRSNGTYVAPYTRSAPNSSKSDNYSSPGNYNPDTESVTGGAPKTEYSSPPSTSSVVKRDNNGKIERSEMAKNLFKKDHPCPSTGLSSGACTGYVIDHVKPLYKGGSDLPSNMQWQTEAAAKAKDKWE